MKKGIILLLFICSSIAGSAQTGYLGDLNAVEFKISMTPSRDRKNKIVDVDGEDYLYSSLRYALPSYQLNIARTVARRIELSAGFEFAAMSLYADEVKTETSSNYIMLDNLKANRFGANFELRFYRKGCFSPIGKYVGFSLNFGKSNVKTVDGLTYGSTGNSLSDGGYFSSSNFFTRKREIGTTATELDLIRASSTYTALRFTIGRNYPLGNGLTLNVGMTAPLLSYYNGGYGGKNGFSLWGTDTVSIVEGNLEKSLRYTMHKYNRIMLSMSIKKYF